MDGNVLFDSRGYLIHLKSCFVPRSGVSLNEHNEELMSKFNMHDFMGTHTYARVWGCALAHTHTHAHARIFWWSFVE